MTIDNVTSNKLFTTFSVCINYDVVAVDHKCPVLSCLDLFSDVASRFEGPRARADSILLKSYFWSHFKR